jgi:hypothetical protein
LGKVELSPWPREAIDEDERKHMNMKRMRGRNHRPNGGGGGNNGGGGFRNQQNGIPLNRNHVFDSSGPEMRVRGTAQQLYEKYQQLARDASSNGDRVTGEAYYQHAEHYFRIISAINQAQGQPNGQPNGQNGQPYQGANPNHGNAGNGNQERNGNQAEPHSSQSNGGQPNGYYNNQNRRYENNRYENNNGDRQHDVQHSESAQPVEPQRQENRPYEPRIQEPRSQEAKRHEQRNKPDYPRNDPRNERNSERPERYRPETAVVDTRIDISSALEAELAAAVAEPPELVEKPVLEARAIPIISDAPPPAAVAPVSAALESIPVATPKPRGRPRTKAAPKE